MADLTSTHFIEVKYPEPHLERTRSILKTHPEVKELFGKNRATALYTFAIVGSQLALSVLMRNQPWWLLLIAAYLLGAALSHALYVVIHECTHNLVFKKAVFNRFLGLLANLPHVFPGSMAFFKYHLLHHRYQGIIDLDADLPSPSEARFVGNIRWRKALFLLFFPYVLGVLRPLRLKKVRLVDTWFFINVLVQLCFVGALLFFFGWKALLYLILSTVFGIGLHPLGARWIQEHYVFRPNQETYSYYGPLNKICFNVGYHNEHHDLVAVPWSSLPKVRKMAPEFYEPLYSHSSWTALLLRFIFNPGVSLYHRVIRESASPASAAAEAQREDPSPSPPRCSESFA